ncbi:MAG: hypothetical protein IJY25_05315 [Bacilli bacterium]|nr:hypothetical protein [Bacilli bacterium]
MKKKLSLLVFALIINFVLIGKVLGAKEYTCTYSETGYADIYEMNFTSTQKKIEMKSIKSFEGELVGYKFNDQGFLLDEDGYCPSSINVDETNKMITWIASYKGIYILLKKETFDDGSYNCYYSDTPNEIQIKYRSNKDLKINMIGCTATYSRDINCMDYEFDDQGYEAKNADGACPSSVNIDVANKTITWIDDGEGKYVVNGKDGLTDVSDVCNELIKPDSCGTAKGVSCVWNKKEVGGKTYEYCNVDNLLYVSCGDARDIPIQVPALISFLVNLLKIVTPIILIFMGIITLVKALAASKEDEIKKAQGSLVKKLIAAAMVFFVVTIVQFVISLVADAEYESDNGETEKDNFSSCLECFLTNNCEKNAYYKTNISGKEYCTDLGSGNFDLCPGEDL